MSLNILKDTLILKLDVNNGKKMTGPTLKISKALIAPAFVYWSVQVRQAIRAREFSHTADMFRKECAIRRATALAERVESMTELQVINGKEVRKIVASSKDVLGLLDQIELSYARQQELLIKQKSELTEIAGLQSQLKSLAKFSETAINMQVQLLQKRKDLELEDVIDIF